MHNVVTSYFEAIDAIMRYLSSYVLGLCCINALSFELDRKEQFDNYCAKNGLLFIDDEYSKRLTIYSRNLDLAEEHNAIEGVTYSLGETRFSHLTSEEVRRINE